MKPASSLAIASQRSVHAVDDASSRGFSSSARAHRESQPALANRHLGILGALPAHADRAASPDLLAKRPRVTLSAGARLNASHDTSRVIFDVPLKTQSKMTDCWYASIQMLLSWKNGKRTKPKGDSVQYHRNLPFIGRKLAFGSAIGAKIMADNGLVAIGDTLDLDDVHALAKTLAAHGPIIAVGKFDLLRQGHAIVVTGVDAATRQVAIHDPAWMGGVQWKPIDYLGKIFKNPGSNNIDSHSAIVLAAPDAAT